MPDRVAGIPADGEEIDGEHDLFMSVIGREPGNQGLLLRINTGGPWGGFRSYDFDTTHIEHSLLRESRKRSYFSKSFYISIFLILKYEKIYIFIIIHLVYVCYIEIKG